MKYTLRKIFIVLTILFVSIIVNSQVFAADFNVKVNCDGKTIKMTSETQELIWAVENILPGETDESTITIQNIGKKKVDINLKAELQSGEELSKIINLKILKTTSSTNTTETIYTGKYIDLKNINLTVDEKEKSTLKFIASLPIEAGNEYQEKECVIKFALVASGELDTPEKTPEIITTDKIEAPQTGEGIIIYIIGGILLIALIIFLVTFFLNKREKNKKQ